MRAASLRHFGHDRRERVGDGDGRARAIGHDIGPRDDHVAHRVELEQGAVQEGEQLERRAGHDVRRARAEQPCRAAARRHRQHARGGARARARGRLRDQDRGLVIGGEHQHLRLGGIGRDAGEHGIEELRHRGGVLRQHVQHVLPARHTRAFRAHVLTALQFHLMPPSFQWRGPVLVSKV